MLADEVRKLRDGRYIRLGMFALLVLGVLLLGREVFSAYAGGSHGAPDVAATGDATVSGHVLLLGRPNPPDPRWSVPITVTMLTARGDYVWDHVSTTDQSGYFTLTTQLPAGEYLWRAKDPQTLANVGSAILVSGTNMIEMGAFREGDSNNDNCVTALDFGIVKVTFDKSIGDPTYDPRADFNGDNTISVTDFTMQKRSFGQCGAPPYSTSTPTFTPTLTAVPTNTPIYDYTSTPTSIATYGDTSTPTSIATYADTPTPISSPPTSTYTATAVPTIDMPCSLFPPNNIWNRNIAALPTHVLSDNYIASIGVTTPLHTDFGSGLYNGEPIGIPYTTVPGTQPLVPISFTTYVAESDPGPYPIPTNAPIEGGQHSLGDRHVIVVDRETCVAYEMFNSYPLPDGSWQARSGAVWPLNSNALRHLGWTSADAAGLPILPGLVNYDEVATGTITHALRFTAQRTQSAFLWPARHFASVDPNPNLPPMGLRVRLKASVDISHYPAELRVILQALKTYGMFLADNGGAWSITGMPDERWNNDRLAEINNLRGQDFEAVDELGLVVDPNSGQSAPIQPTVVTGLPTPTVTGER